MAVVPAIYRRYKTEIAPGFEGKSPGIVSRVEVFGDETIGDIKVRIFAQPTLFSLTFDEEHTCWIKFTAAS